MFCLKCGKADQQKNTYCRKCGTFLPDFEKAKKRGATPEEHLKANTVLNFMTAIASITLAILLYGFFLGKEGTPPIIYITAGFLTAMFAWQVQIIIRTYKLKKHFKERGNQTSGQTGVPTLDAGAPTVELLNEADFGDIVAASVTENTTRKLKIER